MGSPTTVNHCGFGVEWVYVSEVPAVAPDAVLSTTANKHRPLSGTSQEDLGAPGSRERFRYCRSQFAGPWLDLFFLARVPVGLGLSRRCSFLKLTPFPSIAGFWWEHCIGVRP